MIGKDNSSQSGFQVLLEELGTVPPNQIPYYLGWVNQLLARHNFNPEDVSQKDVRGFLNELIARNSTDWQINQASNALGLYFSRFLEVELPEQIFTWDQIFAEYQSKLEQNGYTANTVKAYTKWCRKFSEFIFPVKPHIADESHFRAFHVHLAMERKLASQTLNQAVKALSFLFSDVLGKTVDHRISSVRAKTPKQLPLTLAVADIRKLFSCMQGQNLLMVQLIYGSGLNLSECISLRIQDIDFKENLIHVSSGVIRDTLLPKTKAIKEHIKKLEQLHRQDIASNVSVSFVPDENDDPFDFGLQWLFPSEKIVLNKQTGTLCRKHIYNTALQKAIKRAAAKAGVPSTHASAQVLRHSFAVAMLDKCHIRELQELLGHQDVRNTMVYEKLRVKNPYDGVVSPIADL